jgi:hypothetical protein
VRIPKFTLVLGALIAPVALAGAMAVSAAPASAGVHPAGNSAHPDATNVCGTFCNDLYSRQFSTQFILSTAGSYNSPVTIAQASDSSVSEDFNAYVVGTLGQLIHAGVISPRSYVALNYPHFYPVLEDEWSPDANSSGFCVGVAGKATNGKLVVLRDCGAAAHTLWVADLKKKQTDSLSTYPFGAVDVPWINASDTSLTHPLALTQHGQSAQLSTSEEVTQFGLVNDNQEWGVNLGPAA